MNRRNLLTLGTAAAVAAAMPFRLLAAPAGSPRFLLVFLRGGYDACNLLVPHSSDFYYESRPHIAIPKPDGTAAGALALDSNWALAPAVRDSLGALYTARQLAFIPFAGTDDTSRSHFETQDSIELGQSGGAHNYQSGFLGRLAGTLGTGAAAPIAFTDALPLCFAGADVPNLSLRDMGKSPFDDRQSKLLAAMYAGNRLSPAVNEGLELRQKVAAEIAGDIADDMKAANRNAINARGFGQVAMRMARMMQDRYRIGFIDVGGWDTHVGEGGAAGTLADRLADLSRGLASFADALGDSWKDTVVVVVSEFGRTFRENGNRGTDHGHGTVYWVMGGGIRGGTIAGEQRRVSRETLFQDRDYPVLNDYRAVLGGLFRTVWGLKTADTARIFPGVTPVDLRLV
jgi:uncharacterized protein (DUF1501 family)